MIWQAAPSRSAQEAALHQHVLSEIRTLCSGRVDPASATEVAKAVERYWDAVPHDASASRDYLLFVIARALAGIGETGAAGEILGSIASGSLDRDMASELPGLAGFTPEMWRLLSSQLIRASRWTSGGDRVMWVLDLRRLRFGEDHCFELSLMPALRRVLRCLAGVWDGAGGDGVLGLRGVAWAGEQVAGGAGRTAKNVAGRIGRFCRDVLVDSMRQRGWERVPRIVSLDPHEQAG